MYVATTLLILAAVGLPDTTSRHPDAVEIFNCKFDRLWDVNYDAWPDKWQRELGPGLPHYVDVAMEPDATAPENTCLTVHVNGGGAHLVSPLMPVSDKFSYKVEARLRVAGLKYARAQVRVEFCGDDGAVLQTVAGPWRTETKGWAPVDIGPVNPTDERISAARIILHVEPGARADLSGEVSLDDVWMARLPKMIVTTASPFNVYTNKDDVEVTCVLSGILDSDPDILFELLDASSQRLEGNRVQLEGRLITERRSKASEFVNAPSERAAYAGSTSWRPPIRKHGFYKVRVTMQTSRGMLDQRVVNIALAPPLERPPGGEFGWSLAGDDIPMSVDELATLLPRVAVNWVKMPVWYGESDAQRGDELVIFAEKLSAKDIEVVGVVDRPPPDSELAKRLSRDATIADVLATDPSGWLALLDPVLTRLSLRVRWWQLGADHDSSYASVANPEESVAKLREMLFRFGQDVNLGIGWKWIQASDATAAATWEFQQYSAAPALSGEELGQYLQLPARKKVQRWVLVEPLPRSDYDLETRARDLVEQMLAAKIHGANAIFASRPFDDERGLMSEKGTPGELLLPWRTTASLLSSARYLGSMDLPRHSHNRLFETPDGDVVMVIWSDRPTQEVVYLGDKVRVLDVWGREQIPEEQNHRQVIAVASLPKFVCGVNSKVACWRMSTRFLTLHVPSVFGKAHANKIEFRNCFTQGTGGTIQLVAPKGWQVSPERIDFKLAAGETIVKPFEISLPFDASSGAAPIRADFIVDADRQYRFSVDRELIVGDGQVELETTTRLEEDGTLVVEQRMINHSAELVDFKCFLYAPGTGRRRQRMQVFRLGGSPDVKTYRYTNGSQLLGAELWLRAEESNGSRVLNHRFIVEQ
jgi:hypothetical protein